MYNRNRPRITGLTNEGEISRRAFVQSVGAATAAMSAGPLTQSVLGMDEQQPASSESYVKQLYDSLTETQKQQVHFDWNHRDDRGLLRTHVEANWHVTKPRVQSSFFTKDQQELIEAIFLGLYNPVWRDRIRKQLRDDTGGSFGKGQSIAIFGEPGTDQFHFVITGRHLTIRCDGNTAEHVAMGGPVFYGHAAEADSEKPDHPGNVYWPQALKANKLYEMLDGKQRKQSLLAKSPPQRNVHFRQRQAEIPGLPISELSADQAEQMQQVLDGLMEIYRQSDRLEIATCMQAQGGLKQCRISFYADDDIGDDGVWDNWRLEGPSFVWHFRGAPHVHVWVNIADDPSVKIST